MQGLVKLGLLELFIYYMIGWLCYTVVFAGTFAILDKWFPRYLKRNKVSLEFSVAALSAVTSVSLPLGWLWIYYGYIDIVLGILIAVVSIYMAYRRLREKAIAPEHVNGDYLGYSTALVLWLGLFFAFGQTA